MSSILFDHSHDDAPNYLTAGGIMAGAFGATSFAMTVWSNDKDKRVSIAPVVREGLGHASQCGVQAQLSF
jgi:hypothetical protein